MARPTVSSLSEEAFTSLGAISKPDSDATGWALLRLLDALLTPLQPVEDVVRDTDQGVGWSGVLDVDRCPVWALRWLGQLAGVRVTKGDETDPAWATRARAEIRNAAGFKRGTPASIVGAAQSTLTGTKSVRLLERDTSPYHLTVITRTAETPESDWKQLVNLVTNPSFEVDTAGWTNVGGLGTMQRAGGANIRQVGAAGLYLNNPTAGGDKYANFQIPAGATLDSIKGKTVTLSAYVYKVGGWTVGTGGIDRTAFVADNAGSAASSTAMTGVPADGPVLTRVSATRTVSPTATVLNCRLYNGGIGDVYWDAIMLHEGTTLLAYFDGATPGHRWTGTPHASNSERVLTTIVRDALLSQKPAGLVLAHVVSDAPLVNEGTDTIDGATVTATIDSATLVDVT